MPPKWNVPQEPGMTQILIFSLISTNKVEMESLGNT